MPRIACIMLTSAVCAWMCMRMNRKGMLDTLNHACKRRGTLRPQEGHVHAMRYAYCCGMRTVVKATRANYDAQRGRTLPPSPHNPSLAYH